jgi:hypothetical protein
MSLDIAVQPKVLIFPVTVVALISASSEGTFKKGSAKDFFRVSDEKLQDQW